MRLLTWFSGLLAGSMLTTSAVGLVGLIVSDVTSRGPRLAVWCGFTIALGLLDLSGRTMFWARQTATHPPPVGSPRMAFFLWGGDLGLGWTTYRASNAYWAWLCAVGLGIAPPSSGVVYACAVGVGILLRMMVHMQGAEGHASTHRLLPLALYNRVAALSGLLMITVAAAVVIRASS